MLSDSDISKLSSSDADKISPPIMLSALNNKIPQSKREIQSDDDDEEEEEEEEEEESDEEYDEDEEEEELSESEISSLLNLAVEHDRVDILKEILQKHSEYLNGINPKQQPTPLHISISSGSLQSLNCLLRMGANPSLRPTQIPKEIKNYAQIYRKYHDKTAYQVKEIASSKADEKKKRFQIDQAFFIEIVRAMSAGDISRVAELLESGYNPGKSILDWIPENDADLEIKVLNILKKYGISEFPHVPNKEDDAPEQNKQATQTQLKQKKQPEIIVIETQTPSSSSSTQPNNINNVSKNKELFKLRQKLEEKQALEHQLSLSIEEIVQFITISQSLILNGSSALINHVKRMKAQKIQKEVEIEQYMTLCDSLRNEIAKEQTNTADQSGNQVPTTNTNEEITDLTFNKEKRRLEKLLEDNEKKLNKMKASLMDLTEENTRILTEIDQLGLAGALRLARKLHEEVRALEFQVKFVKDEESQLTSQLALLRGETLCDQSNSEIIQEEADNSQDVQDLHNLESNDENHSGEEDDEDAEYEDDEEDNDDSQRNSARILSGRSRALMARPATPSLDFWEIIRRIIGIAIKKDTSTRAASTNVMII